jgi:hypothetical protein
MRATNPGTTPLIIALAMLSLVASGFAQGTYGPNRGWSRRGMGPGGGHMGPRSERRLPSPGQVEGPATPSVLKDLVDLNPDQLRNYTARYNEHIAATKVVRDSLRTTIQTMREEFENGSRESARERRPTAEQLWKDLSPRDQAFSKGLKDLLTKKQLGVYQKWEKEQAPTEPWGRRSGQPPGTDDARSI